MPITRCRPRPPPPQVNVSAAGAASPPRRVLTGGAVVAVTPGCGGAPDEGAALSLSPRYRVQMENPYRAPSVVVRNERAPS
jgi:hypothetical protein